jgi:ribose-phosphate pyrophosphokinase
VAKFADQEIMVFLKENVEKKEVIAFGSSYPPSDNLVELLILINTLKVNGAKKISVIIPYFGYAKADHVNPKGASLTAKLMAQAIEMAGADKIMAINMHSERVRKFFKKKLIHLSAMEILASHYRREELINFIIAAPDKGGVPRAQEFACLMSNELVIVEKSRSGFDKSKVVEVYGNVEDKNVIIVDDMIQSGGTMLGAAREFKKRGAKNIYIAVTHFVFSGPAVEKLQKEKFIREVVFTNTIPQEKKLPKKFKQVKIDDLIVEAIKKEKF